MRKQWLPAVAATLAACGEVRAAFPRLAEEQGIDPLIVDALAPVVLACERGEPGALLELALQYDAQGLSGLAAETLAECLRRGGAELGGAEERVRFHLARNLEACGRYEEALQAFEQARSLAPAYGPAHWRTGNLLLELSRLDEARAAFARALELEPDALAPQLGMARLELQADRPEAARARLAPLAEQHPRERLVHGLLARAHVRLGDEARARAALLREDQASESSWTDTWTAEVQAREAGAMRAASQANQALLAGRPQEAVALLEPLRRASGENPVLVLMLIKALIEARQLDEALTRIAAARQHMPEHFKLELYEGLVHAERRDRPRARTHLRRALELNPAFGPTLAALGELELAVGRLGPARVLLARALEQGEEDLRTRLLLARAQIELEEYGEAEQLLSGTCADFPAQVAPFAHLAEARARRGDAPGARTALARAEELEPANNHVEKVRQLLYALAASGAPGR